MSMPLFPIARRRPSRLVVAGLLALAVGHARPATAQEERPLPEPDPVVLPDPSPVPIATAGTFGFDLTNARAAVVTAGGTYSESLALRCDLGPSTANLSVSVEPAAFTATVSPTRVTTPGRFTVSAAIPLTTPANEYRVTITATPVSGRCAANSTTRLVLVEKPIRLTVQPTTQTLAAGATTSYTVTVGRSHGANGRVDFRTSGLPADFQTTFTPASTTGTTATLSVFIPQGSTGCAAPAGCDFRIRGSANVEVQAAAAQLTVRKQVMLAVASPSQSIPAGSETSFEVQVRRSGYAGNVRLRSDVLERPASGGFASSFDPDGFTTAPTVQFRVRLSPGGAGRYRFRLTPEIPGNPPDVAVVPVDVTLDAQGPRGVTVTLSPASRTVAPGGITTYDLAILKNGVASVRYAGVTNLDPILALVSPDRLVDPTRLTVAVAANAPNGTFPFEARVEFDGDGGPVSQVSNTANLVIGGGGGGPGSVRLEVDPASKDIDAGSSRTFPVVVRPLDGFRGFVTLFFQPASDSPTVSPSFDPTDFDFAASSAPQSATLTLGAPAGTATGGPYTASVGGSASGGAAVTPAAVNYRLVGAAQPALSLRLEPPNFTVRSGDPLSLTATVTRLNGCNGALIVNGSSNPATAFGISFGPAPGSPDTFRATPTAGTVTQSTAVTITASALAQGCLGASASSTGTINPRLIPPPPLGTATISSFSPANGSAGTNIQIFGTGFENVQNVLFSGPNGFIGGAYAVITPNQINASVPGFAVTGPIQVVTSSGTATSSMVFVVP